MPSFARREIVDPDQRMRFLRLIDIESPPPALRAG